MINPLISVCIPAYNCEEFIVECLHSLCDQTYKNIELIVIDDGSADDTFAHAKSIRDDRITLIKTANGGASKARNTAFGRSKGEYIIFFDADDYVKPDFIKRQVEKINGQDDVVVLSGWGRFYKNDLTTFQNQPIPFNDMSFEEWICHYWYNVTPMTTPGRALIPRQIVEQAGIWNENLSLNDDLDFFTRIFLSAQKIIFNHEALFYYRSGVEGLSGKKTHHAYQSLFASIEISTGLVLERYGNQQLIKKACANLWQSFLYEIYPAETEMAAIANSKISALGGSNYPFQAGGYTKILAKTIGWQATKKIKLFLAGC